MSDTHSVHSVALRLAASLDLKAAQPLLEALLAARGADIAIDASEVRRLGAQCLQVLLAGCEAWARDGRRFEITEPSAAFVEGLAQMGAAERLGLTPIQELCA